MRSRVSVLIAIVLGGFLVACGSSPTRSDKVQDAAKVYAELGIGYMREGRLAVALKELQRALEIDPDLPMANNGIAVLYERLGEDEKADKHFRKAIAGKSVDPASANNYGTFLCGKRRYDEAEKMFLAAAADPLYQTWTAYTNAGSCAARIPDVAKAEVYLRQALSANPQFAPALQLMLQISYENGDYLAARGYLARYLAVAAHRPETLWYGILTERALGDVDRARSYELLLQAEFSDSEQAERLLELKRNDEASRD